jgi:hypothetical protein
MENVAPELIKHREICFCQLHPDPHQAQTVMLLLSDIDGILGVRLGEGERVQVSYDLSRLSLKIIDEALIELGFHLDNSLFNKLMRALHYYSEEAQCANLGCHRGGSNHTLDIFIQRYQHLPHGCRDNRPEHWRRYL